jgi:hypothetical protein
MAVIKRHLIDFHEINDSGFIREVFEQAGIIHKKDEIIMKDVIEIVLDGRITPGVNKIQPANILHFIVGKLKDNDSGARLNLTVFKGSRGKVTGDIGINTMNGSQWDGMLPVIMDDIISQVVTIEHNGNKDRTFSHEFKVLINNQ